MYSIGSHCIHCDNVTVVIQLFTCTTCSSISTASCSLMIREVFGANLTRTGSVAPSVRQKMSRKANSPFSFFNKKASLKLTGKSVSRRSASNRKIAVHKVDSGRRGAPTVANHFRVCAGLTVTAVHRDCT